jgi:phosphoglycolate phosphatase-like HAD superfamily hydrolase
MSLYLIVFDCDGVIIESVDAKTHAFARVAARYGQEASDRLVAFHRANGGVSRVKKFEWLFAEVLRRELSEDILQSLTDAFARYSLDEVLHCAEVPGVLTALNRWKGRVPLYVASGAPHAELGEVLRQRGLAGYFDGIFGSPPGKAELLRSILKTANVHPADAVMIGDSSTDMHAAETTGVRFYGRGEYFRHSGYPWHHDLTRLNDYLEALAQEA